MLAMISYSPMYSCSAVLENRKATFECKYLSSALRFTLCCVLCTAHSTYLPGTSDKDVFDEKFSKIPVCCTKTVCLCL